MVEWEIIRPKKIQFSQKGQNRNLGQNFEMYSLDFG